jgi:hypothetical protein
MSGWGWAKVILLAFALLNATALFYGFLFASILGHFLARLRLTAFFISGGCEVQSTPRSLSRTLRLNWPKASSSTLLHEIKRISVPSAPSMRATVGRSLS